MTHSTLATPVSSTSSSSDDFSSSYFGKQNKNPKSPAQFTQSIAGLLFVVTANYGIIANLADGIVSLGHGDLEFVKWESSGTSGV